jgi:molybdenum cofactor cytidylyltransferase
MLANEIAAVILAAGGSSRFARPKQLVQFRGKSLLRRIVDAAAEAKCSPVVVVIGSETEKTRDELAGTSAIAVENKDWQRGIGTSIRGGVQGVIDNATKEGRFPLARRSLAKAAKRPSAAEKPPLLEGIVLLTCDQPFVDAQTIEQLIALRKKTKKTIVVSSYSDTLGVPALFDRSCFAELLALDDDSGAKPIILSKRERVAEFPFPEGKIDIDTVEDLELAQRTQRSRRD